MYLRFADNRVTPLSLPDRFFSGVSGSNSLQTFCSQTNHHICPFPAVNADPVSQILRLSARLPPPVPASQSLRRFMITQKLLLQYHNCRRISCTTGQSQWRTRHFAAYPFQVLQENLSPQDISAFPDFP